MGIGIIHEGRIVGLGMAGERAVGSGDWTTLDDAFDQFVERSVYHGGYSGRASLTDPSRNAHPAVKTMGAARSDP